MPRGSALEFQRLRKKVSVFSLSLVASPILASLLLVSDTAFSGRETHVWTLGNVYYQIDDFFFWNYGSIPNVSRGKVRVTVMATGKISKIQNLIPLNLIEVSRTKVHFTFHFNFRQKCKVLVFQARKSTALNADFRILLVLLFPLIFSKKVKVWQRNFRCRCTFSCLIVQKQLSPSFFEEESVC